MAPVHAYDVALQEALPRGIAAVRTRVPASRIVAVFRTCLDRVYAARRTHSLPLDGQNIFVYRDVHEAPGLVDVDFGVGVAGPFPEANGVVYSLTPGGTAAMTTHLGEYADLGHAHAALVAWCRSHGLASAGTRWEVYGHWQEGVVPRTDVYHLVTPHP